jgi:hypothetical protein
VYDSIRVNFVNDLKNLTSVGEIYLTKVNIVVGAGRSPVWTNLVQGRYLVFVRDKLVNDPTA